VDSTPEGRRHNLVDPKTGRDIVEFVDAVKAIAQRRVGDPRRRRFGDRPWTPLEIGRRSSAW